MAGSRVPDVVNAAIDALKVDTTLTGLVAAKSYTYVPQGTDPPYTVTLGGDEIPWVVEFDDDNGARQVDVLVQCVSTQKGTAEVDGIASAVLSVLLEDETWSGVSGFEQVEFVRNTAQPPLDLLTNGVLWFTRTVAVRVSVQ